MRTTVWRRWCVRFVRKARKLTICLPCERPMFLERCSATSQLQRGCIFGVTRRNNDGCVSRRREASPVRKTRRSPPPDGDAFLPQETPDTRSRRPQHEPSVRLQQPDPTHMRGGTGKKQETPGRNETQAASQTKPEETSRASDTPEEHAASNPRKKPDGRQETRSKHDHKEEARSRLLK